ncbi:MAG: sigma 54-interacting transcriptional regulator [Clostridiales Family XIII bacterium]|jgi:PAS domain S-box-containing protein|nr:sigma 54-interacting transcriptional regulator [Clostridiales Family XIII bacterium]
MEEQYEHILDNMSEEVSREDPDGLITYVNQAFCKYYGLTREQAIGMRALDVVIPEDRHLYDVVQSMTPENPTYRINCRVRKADGSVSWIQSSGRAYFNEKGEFVELFDVSMDISHLKARERELLARSDELSAAVREKAQELEAVNERLTQVNSQLQSRTTRPASEIHALVNRISGFTAGFTFDDFATESPTFRDAIAYARSISQGESNVLIEGESGTGKEMFAQSIHNHSNRRAGPFIGVNCGAIPAELIESELFGYSEGSFTGAVKGGKPGKFELAAGGTIFLDEIADMPLAQQVALLRVIQEKQIVRIGDSREIPVDARIVCATNKDLLREVRRGHFREDLYYRLNVLNLKIPPLRERREDIPLLVGQFFAKLGAKGAAAKIDPAVMELFLQYDWPGNVRELQNVVERLHCLPGGGQGGLQHLPGHVLPLDARAKAAPAAADAAGPGAGPAEGPAGGAPLARLKETHQSEYDRQERQHIESMLALFDGNISLAARKMNIARGTLYRKMRKHGL